MRISEDTARALACSQLIASERHTSLIRDTFLFAAMCLTESPAKETIDENVQDISAIFEKLGINGDYELDEDTFKALADKAFSNLRMDVRRLFANAAELSRRTGGRGAVGTEHLLFVILSKKVSNHIEIFDALEAAGADLEGLRNSLINSFNESMSSSGDDDDEDEEEGLFGGDERPGNNAPPRRNPEEGKSRKGGKGGHKTLEKFGKNLTELAKAGKIDPVIGREEEINRVMQILIRRTKNNPCLVGDPGVGKTAIAEGLALKHH